MIVESYRDSYYLTQKILCKTVLWDKEYYYLQDVDGTIYLTGIDEDGNPRFA